MHIPWFNVALIRQPFKIADHREFKGGGIERRYSSFTCHSPVRPWRTHATYNTMVGLRYPLDQTRKQKGMIVTTKQLFAHAYGKYAVGAYNINNLEQTVGLFRGNLGKSDSNSDPTKPTVSAPFIIQISRGARSYSDKRFLEAMIRAAEEGRGHNIRIEECRLLLPPTKL